MSWSCLVLEVLTKSPDKLRPEEIAKLGQEVVSALEADIADSFQYNFEPIGTSLLCFGQHGRLAIHTWPEHGFATVDVWALHDRLERRTTALAAVFRDRGFEIIVSQRDDYKKS